MSDEREAIRVGVLGARGRMGAEVCKAVDAADDLELVAMIDQGDWLFNANAYLKYTRAEDWGPLMKHQHTAPAEMIHDCTGSVERKNATAGNDVWVSRRSANHASHEPQRSSRAPSPRILLPRTSISMPDGGEPAPTSSGETACSRRLKAA